MRAYINLGFWEQTVKLRHTPILRFDLACRDDGVHLAEEIGMQAKPRGKAAEQERRDLVAVPHELLGSCLEAGCIIRRGPQTLHADHTQLADTQHIKLFSTQQKTVCISLVIFTDC